MLTFNAPAANGTATARKNGRAANGFAHLENWVFDLDNTLYPAACNLFAQVDVKIGQFVADLLKIGMDEAVKIQKEYFRTYGTSLRGLMLHHQVDPDAFLDFVHEIDVTLIPPCPALDQALARLPGRKIIFTNGSHKHAENVINRLGISKQFEAIFDIKAADFVPKPDPFVYELMVRRHWIDPKRSIMVEDLPKNLLPAHDLGMTTVLVRTEEEWAQAGADGDHVHHVTDDLVTWLEAAGRSAAKG
jgi:putative hydrolase of the HAD superfamily